MNRKLCLPALVLGLLCACGLRGEEEPSPASEMPPPAPISAGAVALSSSGQELPEREIGFTTLPVTEESIHTLYGWEGDEIQAITPYQGDFLVEYDSGRLDWIFGETGRRVWLVGGGAVVDAYRILDRGQVEVITTGIERNTPWKGLPETYTVTVLGDENGRLDPTPWNFTAHSETRRTTWLEPSEGFYMGFVDGGNPADTERYEQIYDARIDVDGLSISFIPSGDGMERFQSFFPAATTIPNTQISCVDGDRVMTIHLHNTTLSSGNATREELEGMMEWIEPDSPYQGCYPASFPEGSLGRDNHFFTDAAITQEGEDAVITLRLTDKAYRYTIETGDLQEDGIPFLRLRFRERITWMDEKAS